AERQPELLAGAWGTVLDVLARVDHGPRPRLADRDGAPRVAHQRSGLTVVMAVSRHRDVVQRLPSLSCPVTGPLPHGLIARALRRPALRVRSDPCIIRLKRG